ncbi:hypothetical protein KA107_01725 [Candidatus Pacearchaeota archaeon]|nr:hypothetical protein [Candidatus Pacearchaeota archaeon]
MISPPKRITFVDLHHTSSAIAERLYRFDLQKRGYFVAGIFDNAPGFDFYVGSAGVQIELDNRVPFSVKFRTNSDLIILTNESAQKAIYIDWLISNSRVLPAFVMERNLNLVDQIEIMERELREKLMPYLPEKKR